MKRIRKRIRCRRLKPSKTLAELNPAAVEALTQLYNHDDTYSPLSLSTLYFLSLFETKAMFERESIELIDGDLDTWRRTVRGLRKKDYLIRSGTRIRQQAHDRNAATQLTLTERGKEVLKAFRATLINPVKPLSFQQRINRFKTIHRDFPGLTAKSVAHVLATREGLTDPVELAALTGKTTTTMAAASRRIVSYNLIHCTFDDEPSRARQRLYTVTDKGNDLLRLMKVL